MPGVFAFADQVIGNPQTSLFAAFGSFAVLVLVEFGGRWRTRLVAYLALAAGGVADHGRNALLTRRLARRGRYRSRWVRDALQRRFQRLPRGGLHRSDPPL